jgi:hypothetical protein
MSVQAQSNPTQPQKVKVRISRLNNICKLMECSHPVPPVPEILKHLTTKDRNKISSNLYISANTSLDNVFAHAHWIKVKVWAHAITKAIAEILIDNQQVEQELVVASSPAYLAMGNGIFKLDLTDFAVAGPKALAGLRKKITSDAKIEAELIKANAEKQSSSIIEDANKRAQQLNIECHEKNVLLSTLKHNLATLNVIPEWAQQPPYTICWAYTETYAYPTYYQLLLNFPVTIRITRFTHEVNHKVHVWDAIQHKPVYTSFCIKLFPDNRTLNELGLRLSKTEHYDLPHAKRSSVCMQISDPPDGPLSPQAITHLADSINRAMQTVNMTSLLQTNHRSWFPQIRRSIPRSLLPWFKVGYGYREQSLLPKPDSIEDLNLLEHPTPNPTTSPYTRIEQEQQQQEEQGEENDLISLDPDPGF